MASVYLLFAYISESGVRNAHRLFALDKAKSFILCCACAFPQLQSHVIHAKCSGNCRVLYSSTVKSWILEILSRIRYTKSFTASQRGAHGRGMFKNSSAFVHRRFRCGRIRCLNKWDLHGVFVIIFSLRSEPASEKNSWRFPTARRLRFCSSERG